MRVTYYTLSGKYSEWVCFEHTGFARKKAEQWHRERSRAPIPDTVDEALVVPFGYREPKKIKVRPDGKFQKIVSYEFPTNDEITEAISKQNEYLQAHQPHYEVQDNTTEEQVNWQDNMNVHKTIRIPVDILTILKRISKKNGRTVSAEIRVAIFNHLKKTNKQGD